MSDQIDLEPEEGSEAISETSRIERQELDEATTEPQARIEQTISFEESEQIEMAFKEIVDNNPEGSEDDGSMISTKIPTLNADEDGVWARIPDSGVERGSFFLPDEEETSLLQNEHDGLVVEPVPAEEITTTGSEYLDPENEIHLDGKGADVIEADVVSLVKDAPDAPAPSEPASLDKDGEGTEAFDPRKEYSGVEMEQSEVLRDEDWNEQYPHVEISPDASSPAEFSKVDKFVSEMSTIDDDVGEPRIPSKHPVEIEPLPSREPGGGHLETPEDTASLERSQQEEPVPLEFDSKPIPASGESVRGDDDSRSYNSVDEITSDGKGTDVIDQKRPGGPEDVEGEIRHEDHWSISIDPEGDFPVEGIDEKELDLKWGGPSYKEILDPQSSEVMDHKRPGSSSEPDDLKDPAYLEMKFGEETPVDSKSMDPDPVDVGLEGDMKLKGMRLDPDPITRVSSESAEVDFKVEMKFTEAEFLKDFGEALEQLDIHSAQAVVGRAILDSSFRDILEMDPDQALSGYELTSEEREGLMSIDHIELNRIAEDFINQFTESGEDPDRIKMEESWFIKVLEDASTSVLKLDAQNLAEQLKKSEVVDRITQISGDVKNDEGKEGVALEVSDNLPEISSEGFLDYVKDLKGGTAKAELATHELGSENIEKKNVVEIETELGSLDEETRLSYDLAEQIFVGGQEDLESTANLMKHYLVMKQLLSNEVAALKDEVLNWPGSQVQTIAYSNIIKQTDGTYQKVEHINNMTKDEVKILIPSIEQKIASLTSDIQTLSLSLKEAQQETEDTDQKLSGATETSDDTSSSISKKSR